MPCKCGGETRCVDSRPTGDGHIRRRYVCVCDRRWTTLEVPIGRPRRGTPALRVLKNRIRAGLL